KCDWSSDVCSSDLAEAVPEAEVKVEEEEDLKQEENVLKEEEDQMYQIHLKGGRGPIFTQEQDQEIINMVLANTVMLSGSEKFKPTLSVTMPFSIQYS